MLSPIGWAIFIYFAVGTFLLMEGIVYAWDSTTDYSIPIKILGTIIAIAMWPSAYM